MLEKALERRKNIMVHILVVEDDADLNHAVCRHLNSHSYEATGCLSAKDALESMSETSYDLIISDIMMKNMDGFAFTEEIRRQNTNIPILFISARDDFTAKEKGYHLGIDDYMVKPIDLNELILHVEALLRRANIASEKKLTVGSLVLDENEMTATLNGKVIDLTPREFQILFKLLSYPKHTFTRSQLIEEFSGAESESGLRTVDVFIANIRSKLAGCHDFRIVTVRGLGYKAVLE